MANFETAFEEVKKLVLDFQQNESLFLSPNYAESQIRIDFINKFFTALGWDVDHNIQKNPYEQEVQVETKVHVAHSQKRADYSFYIQPNFRDVKFFVEAKKPSKNLSNANDYFQTCRYGWNAGTQIVFLTDFEEFHILDCRTKPAIDTILNCKIKDYHYSDYTDREKFSEIFWLISHDAVVDHSIEKFADKLPKPRGKAIRKGLHRGEFQSIDEAFLKELDEIRNELAKAFKKNNSHLESEQLTEMTQRTIDRLVFIRFLEDKQIEPDHIIDGLLREVGTNSASTVWQKFIRAGRTLDAKYNGIVFKKHFIDSNDFHEPDDKTFTSICEELAHVNSPYNFDIIPIHILGSIYERFLGKVVIATDKRARIEEKPEVRKAGGVYYTPQYIVNYIVDNTVGKLIEGKSPKEISKMRFADISCGSGSFLITVFDRLLEYHRKWYQNNSEQAKRDGCILSDGRWVLSLKQKQNMLTNNIYGVDLDHQAVEVTQLSLYLKLLEDETTATTHETWVMFKEQLLPNLNNNIICGNSLIGTDILESNLFNSVETRHASSLQEVDELKLKPMNFEDVFPEIMSNGGFDAIVGNPPYGMISDEKIKNYCSKKFETAEGRIDTFEIFIERAIKLLYKNGYLGFIIPNNFMSNLYSRKLRRFLLDKISIYQINNFGMNVFSDPTIHTCILLITNRINSENLVSIRQQILHEDGLKGGFDYQIKQKELGKNEKNSIDIFFDATTKRILDKTNQKSRKLGSLLYVRQCIKTGNDSNYVKKSNTKLGYPWRKSLRGKSIDRYVTFEIDLYIKYGTWLARNWKNKSFYETPKIAIRETGNRIIANIDLDNRYFLSSLYSIYSKQQNDLHDLKFYLAILNSRLSTFIIKKIAFELTKGAFTKMRTNQLAELPIRVIDFDISSEKSSHDKLVQHVDLMLESKKQLTATKTENEKDYLKKKCNAIDRQIDQLVYELYGLTKDEIEIVEKSLG